MWLNTSHSRRLATPHDVRYEYKLAALPLGLIANARNMQAIVAKTNVTLSFMVIRLPGERIGGNRKGWT